jgi:hypothetical protein
VLRNNALQVTGTAIEDPPSGGPLIDRAVPLPNVSDSFLGTGPDTGAYEQ